MYFPGKNYGPEVLEHFLRVRRSTGTLFAHVRTEGPAIQTPLLSSLPHPRLLPARVPPVFDAEKYLKGPYTSNDTLWAILWPHLIPICLINAPTFNFHGICQQGRIPPPLGIQRVPNYTKRL